MPAAGVEELFLPSTPGKFKDKSHSLHRQFHRCFASTSTTFLCALFLLALTASYWSFRSFVDSGGRYLSTAWGGAHWEKQVRASAQIRRRDGLSVLVTGAAGFVGTHVSLALKKRGDGVVGLDNFNSYYDPSLKKARRDLLVSRGVVVVDGDINDARLLAKLFETTPFSHVMHLAAQAGVRYALENPQSYVRSNIAGLVTLLEACRSADPQPSIVWASSSSVYGLNEKVPFSESDRTDRPASLYAATKKAGEEITHAYNHIYGLSITGLRFFTVYGPWGRPDMAYFSFTRNILLGKPITVYRGKNRVDLARDFTYIDDVVKGCVASLDTAEKSTGSGRKKWGPAQYRIFNLGNTSPVTVPMMVGMLEKQLKVKAKKHVVEMPGNGDVPYTHANISSAQRELGYKPTTDLETGLKKFVKWYLWYYQKNRGTRFQGRARMGGCLLHQDEVALCWFDCNDEIQDARYLAAIKGMEILQDLGWSNPIIGLDDRKAVEYPSQRLKELEHVESDAEGVIPHFSVLKSFLCVNGRVIFVPTVFNSVPTILVRRAKLSNRSSIWCPSATDVIRKYFVPPSFWS